MKSNNMAKKRVYSILCPIHKVEIGEWDADTEGFNHLAFYCGKCKKMIKFNKDNFVKHLTSGNFPVKYL